MKLAYYIDSDEDPVWELYKVNKRIYFYTLKIWVEDFPSFIPNEKIVLMLI